MDGTQLLQRQIRTDNRVGFKKLRRMMGDTAFARHQREHQTTGCLSKGLPNRSIIGVVNGREFHATKGPRRKSS
jgi:hypothetical protein